MLVLTANPISTPINAHGVVSSSSIIFMVVVAAMDVGATVVGFLVVVVITVVGLLVNTVVVVRSSPTSTGPTMIGSVANVFPMSKVRSLKPKTLQIKSHTNTNNTLTCCSQLPCSPTVELCVVELRTRVFVAARHGHGWRWQLHVRHRVWRRCRCRAYNKRVRSTELARGVVAPASHAAVGLEKRAGVRAATGHGGHARVGAQIDRSHRGNGHRFTTATTETH